MKRQRSILAAAVAGAAGLLLALQGSLLALGYKDTPMLPGGKWHVHDGDRPQPPVVTPGTASTQDAPGKPPSDAIVLFDGTNLDHWTKEDGSPAGFKLVDGAMVVSGGSIISKDQFGDAQYHVEWSAPTPAVGSDQGRGNSGVIIMRRYEIQVLDNYQNLTYPDGMAGAVYGQYPPLVNACRPPGQWNTYDIMWEAPRFEGNKLVKPACVTVLFNGLLVQNHTEVIGTMAFRALAQYSPHPPKQPLLLQDHGNPVRYRNIWVRELKERDAPAAP